MRQTTSWSSSPPVPDDFEPAAGPDRQTALDIVAALRQGTVPTRGLAHLATGLDPLVEAVQRELDQVALGRGAVKLVRGEYGCGKTFAARHLAALARARGFASTEVQVSVNDTPLHKLETVYRRALERLQTPAAVTGALQALVDAWLYDVGEEVGQLRGLEEDDPAFAAAVEERLEAKLADVSAINPAFAASLRGYHRAQAAGEFAAAQGLLAWLAGQPHVDRSVKAKAGLKGEVDGQAALAFLRGVLGLLRQSGYQGLVLVLDEVETLQRLDALTREKALHALRQLVDGLHDGQLPGLYLLVTGTRDLFEGPKGVKSLPPLYQRVGARFGDDPRHDNLRAPQVRLLPFDRARLLEVAERVAAIYPAEAPERVRSRVTREVLERIVDAVATGFGGRVEVAPRVFLRDLVDVCDKVDQFDDYDPATGYGLQVDEAELEPVELHAWRRGGAGSTGRLDG